MDAILSIAGPDVPGKLRSGRLARLALPGRAWPHSASMLLPATGVLDDLPRVGWHALEELVVHGKPVDTAVVPVQRLMLLSFVETGKLLESARIAVSSA
jgi:hypothetical protein